MVSVALMKKVIVITVIVKNYICQFYDIRSSLASMISEYNTNTQRSYPKNTVYEFSLSRK